MATAIPHMHVATANRIAMVRTIQQDDRRTVTLSRGAVHDRELVVSPAIRFGWQRRAGSAALLGCGLCRALCGRRFRRLLRGLRSRFRRRYFLPTTLRWGLFCALLGDRLLRGPLGRGLC